MPVLTSVSGTGAGLELGLELGLGSWEELGARKHKVITTIAE
jgi:hypothetical protein